MGFDTSTTRYFPPPAFSNPFWCLAILICYAITLFAQPRVHPPKCQLYTSHNPAIIHGETFYLNPNMEDILLFDDRSESNEHAVGWGSKPQIQECEKGKEAYEMPTNT